MTLFALTNGYNSNTAMILGPMQVKPALREKAGLLMNIHLVGGIFGGSIIATFVMVHVV